MFCVGIRYLQLLLDELRFKLAVDREQQRDDALVPHSIRCSTERHIRYELQAWEPSPQQS